MHPERLPASAAPLRRRAQRRQDRGHRPWCYRRPPHRPDAYPPQRELSVTLCHTGTKDLAAETREADIVIAAAGQPHMLTADMIKEGAALLDVGVSRVDGKLTGDIHPDCWDKAGFVSPNPGGVGPLTRAFLVRNIVERAEKLA